MNLNLKKLRWEKLRNWSATSSDLKLNLPVTLEDIYNGNEKKVRIKRYETCIDCNGSGCKKGYDKQTCNICSGSGEIRKVQRSFLGQIVNVQPCYNCSGSWKIIKNPCLNCKGDGRNKQQSSILLEVPTGVNSGNYLTKRGVGNAGLNGAPSGNLIVIFEVIDHSIFLRDNNNILLDAWIDFSIAVFGDYIEVPTLGSKVKLKIPAGTKSGQILRLKGKGIPELNSHRIGDLLVRININTPKNIGKKTKELLELLKIENFTEPEFKKFNI